MSRGALAVLVTLALVACDRGPAPQAAPAEPASATAAIQGPAPAEPAPAAPPAAPANPLLDAGVIASTDTLASLRARLGDANVVATKVPGAEGEELDGWIAFPDDATRRIYVYLDDAGAPTMARLLDPESTWQRSDGVRTGLTLAVLVERNGAPIDFLGFDWDYGGAITDWNGGRLAHDPPLGAVQLCPPEEGSGEAGYPSGDAEFASDLPWVVAHPPMVCGFSVNLAPTAAPEPAP